MKEQFTDAVLIRLDTTSSFSAQQLAMIREAITAVADRYVITPNGNEVVAYDCLQPEGYKAFLVIKKAEGLSDNSIKAYKHVIDRFLIAVMKPLENITTTDVQLYLYKKQNGDGNQATSVNNHRRILSGFFGWLHDGGWIQENPMRNIKPVKGLKKAYEPITSEQFELVMGKLKSPRDRAIVAVIAGSGIRIGEACSMRLNRLDLDGRRFYVTGKGNKERLCFLTPRALYELKKYLMTRVDDSPWVFVSRRAPHGKIRPSAIQHLLNEVSEELGFRIHPHKLRHFFADNAHEAGIDILDISRMLGHESVDTTKIYLTANADDLAHKHMKLR